MSSRNIIVKERLFECPKCEGVLTPWSNDTHVCDVCGYGKDSDEYDILQKTKREIQN